MHPRDIVPNGGALMKNIAFSVIIKVGKFVLLTAWIVFVCLVTIVIYGPNTSEQDDMVWGCFLAARDKQLDVTWEDIFRTHVHKSGASDVLLVLKPSPNRMFDRVACIQFGDSWRVAYPDP